SGTRIRIVQALVELPEAVAREVREVLDGLARDDDPALAPVASAFVAVLDERSAGEFAAGPPCGRGQPGGRRNSRARSAICISNCAAGSRSCSPKTSSSWRSR